MPADPDHSENDQLTREAAALQKEANRLAGGGSYIQARMRRQEAEALLAKAKERSLALRRNKDG